MTMYREKGKMWDQVGEYLLCSPQVPRDKEVFLNPGRERASDQVFEHTTLPTRDEYEGWPVHKQRELEEQEWSRRENGVWFMNCGVPTWIPGRYYFFLNYHRFGDEKPQYREAHRRVFWLWEYAVSLHNCLGLFLHTRRRWGKTAIAASIALEGASGYRNFRVGIQSKTDDDAAALFINEVQLPFIAMQECPWFLPQTSGTSKPKSELLFDTPANRKKNAANTPDRLRGLRSKIDYRESTETAYDSQGLKLFINDEVGKKQRYDPWARHLIVSKQFYPNGYIVGKEFAMTTSDENDDDSVAKTKEFWDESDPALIPKRKGLIRYFVPDYEGYMVDKHGRDTKEGLADLDAEREAARLKGLVAWTRHRRAYPRDINEAHLESVSTDCPFNSKHIGDAMTAIAEHEVIFGQPLVKRYRLYWANAERTEVAITEDENGRFWLSWVPPKSWMNKTKQVGEVTTSLGRVPRWVPQNAMVFGNGADPFDMQDPEGAASKGAMHGIYNWDSAMEARRGEDTYWPSDSYFMEYAERPDDPDTYYEDGVMWAHWTGSKFFVETQKVNFSNHFRKRGYGDFLAMAPQATLAAASQQPKKPGAASSPRMINEYTNAKIVYYQKYVGSANSEDSVGNPYGPGYNDDGVAYDYRRMPFTRTMTQDLRFKPADPNVRKKSDLSVSSGFARVYVTGVMLRKPAESKGKAAFTAKGVLKAVGGMFR